MTQKITQELLAHPRTLNQIHQYLQSPVHAIGLSGETGAGKGYAAAFIGASLLGIAVEAIESHPYVFRIDAQAQKTGIDDVRELKIFLTLTVPGIGVIKRVVILEHFDTVGREAQNSLLKTLEEPPADTIIVVTYSRDTSILPTIHSRLQSIQILPLSQTQVQQQLQDYEEPELTKAFLISGGLIGLLTSLLQAKTDHPLLMAINQAREIIALSRLKRLALVDKLVKNANLPVALLLDALYRLLDASYRQSLKTKSNGELQATVKKLNLIEEAINDLDQNVQAKLVMSRLFTKL